MPSAIIQRGQLNATQFGTGQFNQDLSVTESLPDGATTGLLRSHSGFGHFGARQYGRSYAYSFPTATVVVRTSATIVITSSSGGILGELRTDVAKPLLKSVQFTIIRGSCADCTIILNRPPSFPLPDLSYVSIDVPNSSFGWYFGQLFETPELGDDSEKEYKYRGMGLFNDLARLGADDYSFSFAALSDVGAAVLEIANTAIAADTKIGVTTTKINATTGIPFAGTFTPDKSSLKKLLEDLATMTGHDTGVDGDGDFFFLAKNSNVVKTFTAGYNLHELKSEKNTSVVRNRIVGTRTTPKGGGGTGWVVGSISIDLASQRKYRTIEETVRAPGDMSDADMQTLTDAILEVKKDPSNSAKCKTYFLNNQSDYILRGASRVIFPFRQYDIDYNSCDDPTADFAVSGTGDLVVSEDASNFLDGSTSCLLTWGSASGDRAETQDEIRAGRIDRLRFYYRPSRAGTYLRVGIGWGVWNEFTKDIPIPGAAVDNFVLFDWDLTDLSVTRINRFAIQILDGLSGTVSVDRIQFSIRGHRHLILENQKQVYRIGADETSIEMELGQVPPRLEGYLQQLFAQAEESRISGEVR